MNWVSITTDNLNDAKVSALVDATRTAALAEGQTDPSPRIIAEEIAAVRAAIKGCASNVLDADTTTVPEDLLGLASRMIVRRLMSRLRIPLNDDERQERSDDIRYLERIATCAVPVGKPDSAETSPSVQAVSNSPRINCKPRRFRTRDQEGL